MIYNNPILVVAYVNNYIKERFMVNIVIIHKQIWIVVSAMWKFDYIIQIFDSCLVHHNCCRKGQQGQSEDFKYS